jgi:hypothetical protein
VFGVPGERVRYRVERPRLLRFLVKQGATWDESWDAAQDAFLEVYQHHKPTFEQLFTVLTGTGRVYLIDGANAARLAVRVESSTSPTTRSPSQ